MAVELLEMNPGNPSFVKVVASPWYLYDLTVETLKIDVYLSYQGKERCFYTYIYTYNDSEKPLMTWDDEEEQTGMTAACEMINTLSDLVAEKDIFNYKKLDLFLKNYAAKKEDSGVKVGLNVIGAISQAIFAATANATDKQMPFLGMYRQNMAKEFEPPIISGDFNTNSGETLAPQINSFPSLLLNVFTGGKDSSSKIRFSRFYLIVDLSPQDMMMDTEEGKEKFDAYKAVLTLNSKLEQAVAAQKNAPSFKKNPEGSWFNAFENINECFKLLEDAITAAGLNTEQKNFVRIGVNCDAAAWYLSDVQKYDWDGGKSQFDQEQLIEFYEKMFTEHPLLTFVEDPFVLDDVAAYKKLQAKLKEASSTVQVGMSSKLFDDDLEKIRDMATFVNPDDEDEPT